jgi:hypothetical protein
VPVEAEDPAEVLVSEMLGDHHLASESIEESALLRSVPVDGLIRDTLRRQKNQMDDLMRVWSERERPAIICVMLMKSYEVTRE